METNRIRQFCAVAETQNLRKASEILGISHGGLFKSLKVLEAELGFALFRKEGRGIVFTEEGKDFYPRALKFLTAHAEMVSFNQTHAKALRLGTFEVFSTYFFSAILAKEFDHSEIILRELIPGRLEQALIENEIDIGLTYEPIPMQGLRILPVVKCTMSIFGKKGVFQSLPFENIPFATPVFPIHSSISGVKGLDGWPDDKIQRHIRYKVDMMETALQLCSEERSVGFFPTFLVELYNKTRIKEFQLCELDGPRALKSVKRTVYLVLRTTSVESKEAKKIAKSLRKFCSGD
jgi:DNA-binding transcriptional LysR family regulator